MGRFTDRLNSAPTSFRSSTRQAHRIEVCQPRSGADTPEALGQGLQRVTNSMQPSPYWGRRKVWDSKANNHNGMFDRKGRVWFAARFRDAQTIRTFAKKDRTILRPRHFRLSGQSPVYDARSQNRAVHFFDTCFQTHHLQFGYDANDTLWTSGGGQVVGWIDTKICDETGDVAKAQGWTPMILDTNGNGKRDDYVEPNQPVDPNKDKRIVAGFYAVMPNPADGSIWGSTVRSSPERSCGSRQDRIRQRLL